MVLWNLLCTIISGYEILSTGPDLLVQFTANSDNPGQGFKANYLFQPDDNSSAGLVSILFRIAAISLSGLIIPQKMHKK